MEHRFENGMDPYASLSPGSALFLLMLSRAGACPRKALPLFMGRGADTSAILAELSRKGLIDCAPGREIRPTGERMGAELLEGRTYSSQDWPEDSLAFCVAAHLEGRDLRFLQAARALLESLCYGPHSSLFAIAYAALGASLARLRPGQAGRADSADSGDDADRAGYADLVRLLTDIQRLAVHMCLNIEAVHAVFTRMRAAAAEIGDRRTLARTDL
ncbi:MAG: hypothetical protein Q4F72_07650, partial [Desulfovibrionaceae bacterium]|nr:hypothetical protein [Desulfovibrionaceae bacterium]